MRISVVTPVRNGLPFLQETLESVLGQKGVDLQYRVVDGGSTDGTLELLRRYEKDLDGWISEPDQGLYDAVGKGLAACDGAVLAYLNADDRYPDPHTLERVVEAFERDPALSFVYGDYGVIDREGRRRGRIRIPACCVRPSLLGAAGFSFLSQPATFWRRSAYEAAGGVDRSFRLAGDYDLLLRLLRQGRAGKLKGILAEARFHPGNLTATAQERNRQELARIARSFGTATLWHQHCLRPLVLATYKACNLPWYLRRLRKGNPYG